MSDSAPPPHLPPPGAGIPFLERLVGGRILKLRRRFVPPSRFIAQFARERRAINALCAGKSQSLLGTRVLIPRLRGLEDSSRFWSVWMTLDHLRIVNDSICTVIADLTQGRLPEREASTAAVKPSPNAGSEAVLAHEASCDRLAALIASTPTLNTRLRHAHPWFGPLDAGAWHAMAGIHMSIHRAQIEHILRRADRRAQ